MVRSLLNFPEVAVLMMEDLVHFWNDEACEKADRQRLQTGVGWKDTMDTQRVEAEQSVTLAGCKVKE